MTVWIFFAFDFWDIGLATLTFITTNGHNSWCDAIKQKLNWTELNWFGIRIGNWIEFEFEFEFEFGIGIGIEFELKLKWNN